MFEKVNPMHPDKIADRIAGAIVDLAYTKSNRPKVAVEVLIGHSVCHIIAETSEHFTDEEIKSIVDRIADTKCKIDYKEVPQDKHLANNQSEEIKCGDNGIFKGVPTHKQEAYLSIIVHDLFDEYPTDGKFIYCWETDTFIGCQSQISKEDFEKATEGVAQNIILNPLGDWTGGVNVDSGATNRKLGSDMGRAVTGGGLHGKDLSKADVAVNIYAHLLAQKSGKEVNLCCAIGDDNIAGTPYSKVVEIAGDYIKSIGGFEKLAEWGLV